MPALALHAFGLTLVVCGILVRKRIAACVAFPLYLIVGLVHKLLQLAIPELPARWLAWLAVDLVQRALCIAVAVEVGFRIFHSKLLGGRAWFRRSLVGILTLGGVFFGLWVLQLRTVASDSQLYYALIEASRRLSAIATWLYATIVFLVGIWYRWPVDPYHRDVLLGLCLYQLAITIFSPGSRLALPLSWPVWLYGALLGLWCWAAWRRDQDLGMDTEMLAFVWPWRKPKV